MRNRENELDVDVIGGSRALTKEEEKVISDFIKASKVPKPKERTPKPKKATKSVQ